jgi:hypothetical protein
MAPLPTLPSAFDPVKFAVRGTPTSPLVHVVGQYPISDQIIKTKVLTFDTGSRLIFRKLDFPFIVVYADEWNLGVHFEIGRDTVFDLNGANGTSAPPPPPTPPGYGHDGNNGLPGFPGRDAQPGFRLPTVFIFAQTTSFNGRPANSLDVNALFYFDGVPGGNGGDGGHGSNGTNGTQGEPGINGGWGDCASGPGWGGRGGNAGYGGMPGYGANGGDAPAVYMFVAPDQLSIFQSNGLTVSLKGGDNGFDGRRGPPGRPGRGGLEGEASGNCSNVGRQGPDGGVPLPCPILEIRKHRGADGKTYVTDYIGFAELQDAPPPP